MCVFAYFADVGEIWSRFSLADRVGHVVHLDSLVSLHSLCLLLSGPQHMQFHEVFAPLNFTIRFKQFQFAYETGSCVVVDHAWCESALGVLRAETRLTVYRPLQVYRRSGSRSSG